MCRNYGYINALKLHHWGNHMDYCNSVYHVTHRPLGDVVIISKLHPLILVHDYFLGNCSQVNTMEHICWRSTLFHVIVWSCQVKAINWSNVDPELCWHMASPCHTEFRWYFLEITCRFILTILVYISYLLIIRNIFWLDWKFFATAMIHIQTTYREVHHPVCSGFYYKKEIN